MKNCVLILLALTLGCAVADDEHLAPDDASDAAVHDVTFPNLDVPRPPLDCASRTSCGACTVEAGCGFCRSTGRCQAGTESGPAKGSCGGAWVVRASECPGPQPVDVPVPQPPPDVPRDVRDVEVNACMGCSATGTCPAGFECARRACDARRACYPLAPSASCALIDGVACPAVAPYARCSDDASCGSLATCTVGSTPGYGYGWTVPRCTYALGCQGRAGGGCSLYGPNACPQPSGFPGVTAECALTGDTLRGGCYGCVLRCAPGAACPYGLQCVGGRCTDSLVGAPCIFAGGTGDGGECGGLQCVASQTTPFCTAACTDNAAQATEQATCGGPSSTCLTQGDPPAHRSACAQACRATATTMATGACRPGQVCTGWWYTHASGRPDVTGCASFCSEDAHCREGARCNTRTGACEATGYDLTRLPDGSPCNPRVTVTPPGETTPRNVQCRGVCFRAGDETQGVCGSFLNLRVTVACPDEPRYVLPLAPADDALALCLWRNCTRNADCRAPHICRYPEAMGVPRTDLRPTCDYPTSAQRVGLP